jgi:hypothetical protein
MQGPPALRISAPTALCPLSAATPQTIKRHCNISNLHLYLPPHRAMQLCIIYESSKFRMVVRWSPLDLLGIRDIWFSLFASDFVNENFLLSFGSVVTFISNWFSFFVRLLSWAVVYCIHGSECALGSLQFVLTD